MFEKQVLHYVFLGILLAGVLALARGNVLTGQLWGVGTSTWLILAIAIPIVHQIFTWFVWRVELHHRLWTRWFGEKSFLIYGIGFMLLFLPGILITVAITFCCIYMLPLMTDRGMNVIDAVKESYAMSRRGEIVDHVVVVIIFMAITMIGGTVFIGVLFTQPLATLFLLSTYEEKSSATPPPAPQQP